MEQGLPTRPEHMSSPPICSNINTTGATYGAETAYSSGAHEFTTVCNKNNTTGATYGAGTVYSSGAHEFTTGL